MVRKMSGASQEKVIKNRSKISLDYSKFLDDDFDVKEWVNGAFRSQKEGTKDQHATTLVMKLQMFIQEVNNVIEDSCQQTITNLPRVMRELEAVRQEAALLQEQMKVIKHDVQKVEHDTAQSMQMLLQLDSIKSRMQAASGALQEADNWTTLSADVDEVYESGDASAIAAKLVGLQQSLNMLTDVPDYAERCQFLETLKNRLEAMLSPQVVTAFSAQSLDTAKMYVRIFSEIDRLQQLNKYYHKCQKGPLLDEWRRIHSEDKGLAERLTELYDLLLSTWHTQVTWCSQVFEDPVPIVCELVTETLTSLDPSIPACINTHLQNASEPLSELIELKQASQRFASGLQSAIAAQTTGDVYAPYARGLATCIYLPYRAYIRQYGRLEESRLNSALEAIQLDAGDVIDTITLLAESVNLLFTAAANANDRCCQLTNGTGYVGLINAIQHYMSSYVVELRRVLVNMREKCQLADVTDEDWPLFQNALRLVEASGEMILQCEELDQKLVSSLVSTVGKYCTTSHSPDPTKNEVSAFEDYATLLLDNSDDRLGLLGLMTRLHDGDVASVLDEVSHELQELCQEVHRFTFDIVFAPLEKQLATVSSMEIWTSGSGKDALTSELPTFSLTPQEYITRIGNYLMTVPQQLETFSLQDNPALMAAVKHGNLPYRTQPGETGDQLADIWLESVCAGTEHHYTEQILKIQHLSLHATKQLITDINYLCNVLEDLGLQVSENLQQTVTLLTSTETDFTDHCDSMPQRLTNAVAKMRDLNIHE